ncbi:MAG: ribonucleoside-diphosphate reductase alpha chain, partial [Parcubacteria group bacterium Gr01-1014_106]
TYGTYEDGTLAEIFVTISKQGSTLAGLLDSFAIAISIALQHGVPLKVLARKFVYARYEPAGYTENPDIQIATSITDYIFRYLALRFLAPSDLGEIGVQSLTLESGNGGDHGTERRILEAAARLPANGSARSATPSAANGVFYNMSGNGHPTLYADSVCRACGGMMVQTGTCKTCFQCGATSGGC